MSKKKNEVQQDITTLDPRSNIIIKGARMHNLKNVDVAIPRNKFVVITGLSGSGKSSLAFDTLYAEGQRRYVESLSAYARQFLGKLEKPQVDYIKGISPAIAIEQKVISRNPRSTVGTITEIYDYFKLLFARVGKTYSPVSNRQVKRNTVSDVVDFLKTAPENTRALITSRITPTKDRPLARQIELLMQQGFTRLVRNGEVLRMEDFTAPAKNDKELTYLLVDRLVIKKDDEDFQNRAADSTQTAFYEGQGECQVWLGRADSSYEMFSFSNRFELDGMTFEEPDVNFFTFNNPVGACKTCEGFGSIIGIDPDLVIPNKGLSVYNNAIACWNGEVMKTYKERLVRNAHHFKFPVHKPIAELSKADYDLLWTGNKYFEGLNDFFHMLERETYKIQYRVMLARYRGKTVCPDCHGTRLRKDANYVKVNGHSISELVLSPVKDLTTFFEELKLDEHDEKIARRLLVEIRNRLKYLMDVGLGYLTLNRVANTLSGGESQRINLATQLGSTLVGSLYILDEPSIGLHPRDTQRLITVLESLQKQGNTVIVVEHDEEIMKRADQLIDIGPEAGSLGGTLVFQGTHDELMTSENSITARYLTGRMKIDVPAKRRKAREFIEVSQLNDHNLKNISVRFPLKTLCVITGVSGSGKSTMVKKGLMPSMNRYLDNITGGTAPSVLGGDFTRIRQMVYVDQNPIGKSTRSNPVTYIKAFDEIRSLFADQGLARARNYKAGFFSFNVEGGRCEVCQGEGEINVEMQFMADIQLKCEACNGKRYKAETLEVLYGGKSISDVLDMTVDDAIALFAADKKNKIAVKIAEKLQPLQDVGLGYVQLGQSSSTLSGGEAQRIKLATFLGAGTNAPPTLFIFDEPTTGLHFHDVAKLLKSLNALIDEGHSVIIIEHNTDVIKNADWVIDMGPEGGEDGGHVVFEGTPEELVAAKKGYTWKYLADKL